MMGGIDEVVREGLWEHVRTKTGSEPFKDLFKEHLANNNHLFSLTQTL